MSLRDLLGIDLPIIQAPMAGVQGSALASAVSNAGGLGSLPCAMLSLDAIREELAAIRGQTSRPFNVNFFCHRLPQPDIEREMQWRQALAPYFEGPTAIAISRETENMPAKVLAKFASEHELPKFKAGFVDGAVLDAKGVLALSKLPTKGELVSQLLGGIQGPARNLLSVMQGPARNLASVLKQISEKQS